MSKDHGFSPTDLASGPGKSRAWPGDAIKEVFPVGAKGEPTERDAPPQTLARKKPSRRERDKQKQEVVFGTAARLSRHAVLSGNEGITMLTCVVRCHLRVGP